MMNDTGLRAETFATQPTALGQHCRGRLEHLSGTVPFGADVLRAGSPWAVGRGAGVSQVLFRFGPALFGEKYDDGLAARDHARR